MFSLRWALPLFATLLAVPAVSVQAATFTVTKTADTNDGVCDADCSLREAVSAANAAAGADTIDFAAGGRGSIALTQIGDSDANFGASALLVTGPLTIAGPGAGALTITRSSATNFRLFRIAPATDFSISGATLTGGNSPRTSGSGGFSFFSAGSAATGA